MDQRIPHFEVDQVQVKAVQEFLAELKARAVQVDLHVTAADFPVWLAAVGARSFYASVVESGRRYAHASVFLESGNGWYFSLSCRDTDQLPEWVTWPDGQGTRTYKFTAVMS
jgi:hypothetical protein